MTNTLPRGNFLGSQSIERAAPGFTVALRRATVPPQDVHEHSHDGAHLVLAIDEGYVSAAVGAQTESAPMTLVYNPPGTLHRDRFAVAGGRFVSIDIANDLVPDGIIDPIIVTDRGALFTATRLSTLMSGQNADATELEDELLGLVADLKRPAISSIHAPDWLGAAADAMSDMSGDSGLQVRQIAQTVGVHPVHLARAFRKHLGCSPATYLRHSRLTKATGMLSRQERLAEVAAAAGFADQSHMTRTFQRDYGTTPARFRESFG